MDHPTVSRVYRRARKRLPRISLGTVYRNLKQLAAEGLIREIHTGGLPARFEGNLGRHYHIRCVSCGRLSDLPLSVSRRLEEGAGRSTGYEILGHEVEVQGLCPVSQTGRRTAEKVSSPSARNE